MAAAPRPWSTCPDCSHAEGPLAVLLDCSRQCTSHQRCGVDRTNCGHHGRVSGGVTVGSAPRSKPAVASIALRILIMTVSLARTRHKLRHALTCASRAGAGAKQSDLHQNFTISG